MYINIGGNSVRDVVFNIGGDSVRGVVFNIGRDSVRGAVFKTILNAISVISFSLYVCYHLIHLF